MARGQECVVGIENEWWRSKMHAGRVWMWWAVEGLEHAVGGVKVVVVVVIGCVMVLLVAISIVDT